MKTLNLGWFLSFVEKSQLRMSKKRSMDLRLLYGVAYGHTWFGRWGYRFCRGSLEWKRTITKNLLKFLPHWNLTKLSKILATQTNSKKSSK